MMSYGKSLARKSAPPDPMEALGVGGEEDEEMLEGEAPDEDANDAVAMSAYQDFARAAGFQPKPATFEALKSLIRAVK
jgi:hypothetical protein